MYTEYTPKSKKCNVLMRDFAGSHRLNEDFPWDWTPRRVMEKYGFKFAPDSVEINGFPVSDRMLDEELRTFLRVETIQAMYRKSMRIMVMGQSAHPVKTVMEEFGGDGK